ncbi:synaptonemal complex protein 2 [Oncorhynchus nerka]|nr:synaptonemal complex protein 2-like [Oncorhynchus nerka]
MELYTKQSLKTVQQHVSSISMRVKNYRSQKLEQVRGVLLKEINNLEEDESTLKNMEKELTTYWRKQSVAFHSYQEKETRRLQSLKSTFQTDVCHSLEYEERIFTSQMCLMRKDMKSVQDRLFKEMQDEEIMSVRRGLQALFLPEGPRF